MVPAPMTKMCLMVMLSPPVIASGAKQSPLGLRLPRRHEANSNCASSTPPHVSLCLDRLSTTSNYSDLLDMPGNMCRINIDPLLESIWLFIFRMVDGMCEHFIGLSLEQFIGCLSGKPHDFQRIFKTLIVIIQVRLPICPDRSPSMCRPVRRSICARVTRHWIRNPRSG